MNESIKIYFFELDQNTEFKFLMQGILQFKRDKTNVPVTKRTKQTKTVKKQRIIIIIIIVMIIFKYIQIYFEIYQSFLIS
jgi:hypothetical protein